MRLILAVIGGVLLFFYGQEAFAETLAARQPQQVLVAYAVYCDTSVDRARYSDDLVPSEDLDDDVLVMTEKGYEKLKDNLAATYQDHCGPGIKVSLGE